MMRKTSLILLGAAAGRGRHADRNPAPHLVRCARAQAAAADTYRQLSLFGGRVRAVWRADYVRSRTTAS